MATTAYVNGQVIDGRGKVYQGYVIVDGEKIAEVGPGPVSPSAAAEMLCVQIGARVDPASVFDERFQGCALLELSSVPENSAPFADDLAV
jgi:hypothetical protein